MCIADRAALLDVATCVFTALLVVLAVWVAVLARGTRRPGSNEPQQGPY